MFGLLMLIGGIVLIVGAIAALGVFIYFKVKLRRLLDSAGYEGQNIGDIIREARLQDEVEPKSLASMDRIYLSQIKEDFPGINISEIKRQAEEVILDEYQIEDAEIVLVSYGISSRIARTAVDKSREKGLKVGLLRPITLSPFPVDRIKELSDKGVSFISVEMSNGQLLADVQFAALRKEDTHLVNRMVGNLIELKHVLAKIYEIAGIEDEELDTSKRSDEKASPNIID